jgi:hypothetical protein
MRITTLPFLALATTVLCGPAACGNGNSTNSTGDDGGSSSSGSSSGSSGGSSSGSSSGGSSGSSSGGSSGGSGGGSSGSSSGSSSSSGGDGGGTAIKTVFLILMENHNWSDIYQNTGSAPYINGTLLPEASWCTNYFDNPASAHPSEPNYIWLEAGTNALADHTFSTDADPSASNSSSADHLAKQMTTKGVTWREYAEDITGNDCPISSTGMYATKHVPFVFFTDVVGSPPSSTNAGCKQNIRPYTELAGDLTNGKTAQYNFLTPNLCNDMHDTCTGDSIKQGDDWLSQQIPVIMGSNAYKNGGAIFVTWDESEGGENPIGMIVLSPLAKGKSYQGTKMYYHSSMVRSVQEIFGLTPFLNDAANQTDLADLFTTFP